MERICVGEEKTGGVPYHKSDGVCDTWFYICNILLGYLTLQERIVSY